MSPPAEDSFYGGAADIKPSATQIEHVYSSSEKIDVGEYKAGAMEAEDMEHNMGVLEAVRAYPMASFWAFVMSCTIVRSPLFLPLHRASSPHRGR